MSFTNSFDSRSRPLETLVITLTEEHSSVIRNSNSLTSKVPISLFKCMSWIGLVEEPYGQPLHRITAKIFKIILILTKLDMWISYFIYYGVFDWKVTFTNLVSGISDFGIYFTLYCKRDLLTITVQKLHELSVSSNKRIINFITIVVCCMPVVLLTLRVIDYLEDQWSARFETYGILIENNIIRILFLSIKYFFHVLVHPTLTCLVALLYCVLSQHCCYQINILSEEVFQAYPEQFGPPKQMNILERKARLDDILEKVQAIFSMPSFFIIAGNILFCGSALMTINDINREGLFSYVIVEIALRNIIYISCVFIMLWMTSKLSVQMKKLKNDFFKKVRSRILYTKNLKEINSKRNLFGQEDFVLTECDIILCKRSTILSITGSLIIYIFILINVKTREESY
ncbi:uncharacterized protein NPIL_82451 [Nephila pilipes]|uniref:Uncharacterized protein n=1 Tax=Nephila pilipes TaxID=299642 RepID=A0A8X6QVG6_NEPPI|nr:uncharacterized protein NPIL_82451 [Nephila pilipes]